MADTTFVDGQTVIEAAWLNDVNEVVYNPTAAVIHASSIVNTPYGNIAATDVQTAINELDTEKAKIGANSDITSLTGLTTALSATQGGTAQTTYTTGDILYASAANTLSKLAKGTTGQVLTQGASVPSWATPVANEVVQIVNVTSSAATTGTTIIPFDDTIPQNTEGTEFITLAITPTNASNILHIKGSLLVGSSANAHIIAALFQDTTVDALAAIADYQSTANATKVIDINHYMVAGTTSATTFKIRVGPNSAATLTLNGNGGTRLFGTTIKSSLSITEITA